MVYSARLTGGFPTVGCPGATAHGHIDVILSLELTWLRGKPPACSGFHGRPNSGPGNPLPCEFQGVYLGARDRCVKQPRPPFGAVDPSGLAVGIFQILEVGAKRSQLDRGRSQNARDIRTAANGFRTAQIEV